MNCNGYKKFNLFDLNGTLFVVVLTYSFCRGNSWLSYDNERSIALKSQFAYDHSLAGVMTWSIDTDDFLGMCNGPKFPLLRTINHALYRREKGIYNKAGRGAGGWLAVITVVIAVIAL